MLDKIFLPQGPGDIQIWSILSEHFKAQKLSSFEILIENPIMDLVVWLFGQLIFPRLRTKIQSYFNLKQMLRRCSLNTQINGHLNFYNSMTTRSRSQAPEHQLNQPFGVIIWVTTVDLG